MTQLSHVSLCPSLRSPGCVAYSDVHGSFLAAVPEGNVRVKAKLVTEAVPSTKI